MKSRKQACNALPQVEWFVKHILRILLVTFFSSFLLCTQENFYTIEEVNGIKIIQNYQPKWRSNPQVSIKFMRTYSRPYRVDERY